MKNQNSLRRAQLDDFFLTLRKLNLTKPRSGWVKEIREALGMSMADLAHRMNTIKQRVERIEKDEVSEKVTLQTMSKVAEAMDCEFVYFYVPKKSLQESIELQAERIAKEMLGIVDRTMKLEKQEGTKKSQQRLVNEIKMKLLVENKRLWSKS